MRRAFIFLAKSIENQSKVEVKLPQFPAHIKKSIQKLQEESVETEDTALPKETLSDRDLIRARGFLKYVKPYQPPADLENIFFDVLVETAPELNLADGRSVGEDWRNVNFGANSNLKFRVLSSVEKRLGKVVPGSFLHEIRTVRDLLEFYKIGARVVAPYNETARNQKNLPKNLHITEECVRYDPQRDGPTAYPKRDSKLVNPRFKKLYNDIIAKKEWHEFETRRTRPAGSTASPQEEMWSAKSAGRFDRIMNTFRLKKIDPNIVRGPYP